MKNGRCDLILMAARFTAGQMFTSPISDSSFCGARRREMLRSHTDQFRQSLWWPRSARLLTSHRDHGNRWTIVGGRVFLHNRKVRLVLPGARFGPIEQRPEKETEGNVSQSCVTAGLLTSQRDHGNRWTIVAVRGFFRSRQIRLVLLSARFGPIEQHPEKEAEGDESEGLVAPILLIR